MITVKLNKDDLLSLLQGTLPHPDVVGSDLIKDSGNLDMHGDWTWNVWHLSKMNEEQLLNLYKFCKKSWRLPR